MRLLVTGCSGYVGHQIAQRFARSGVHVYGSTRRPFELDGVPIYTGDHGDRGFVASLVSRCDAVLHFAARTRGHSPEVFERDNENVTTLFCREAREQGKRFVHISSDQAVYQTGFYGKSKLACEQIVAREHEDFVIVRLTAVLGRYAPEMASTFSKIIQRLHGSRTITVPGDCVFDIAPVWVGDIEHCLRKLLELDRMPNDAFELCGPVTTLARLISLFEQRLGVERRRRRLPVRPLQAVARALKPFRMFARLPLDALLDLGAPIAVSHEKLAGVIPFAPTDMELAVPQIEGFPPRVQS